MKKEIVRREVDLKWVRILEFDPTDRGCVVGDPPRSSPNFTEAIRVRARAAGKIYFREWQEQ